MDTIVERKRILVLFFYYDFFIFLRQKIRHLTKIDLRANERTNTFLIALGGA